MKLMEVGLTDETLLLDLLNTTPVVEGMPYDVLAETTTAPGWLREHEVTAAEVADLVSVRNLLQAVVRGTESAVARTPYLDAAALRAHATENGVNWELDVDDARRGAGGPGLGCAADRVSGAATRVREPGLSALPDGSEQAQRKTLVLDDYLREPHEGAPVSPARED